MISKVTKAIADFNLIDEGDTVVVALSGGADSVCLLSVLNSLKEEYNLTLYACHLNHNIRGEEAFRDERFVKSLCNDLGIELFLKSVDVPTLAKSRKISLELCGRNERYSFFNELSKKLCAKIATAHTASDNVETVLYNLARGTSITGLCGIRAKRDENIIRPLISVTRAEVEQYCKDNDLSFVVDSTNLSDDYTRNKIRHNAVPALSEISGDIEGCVSRMCRSMTDIRDFIDKYSIEELKKCKTDYGYSCIKLKKYDKAVLSNMIYIILNQGGVSAEQKHIELIINALSSHGCVSLPNEKYAILKQGVLRITDREICEKSPLSENEILLKDCDFCEYYTKSQLEKINKKLLNDMIDCDIITDSTVIRTRKQGDTFTLYGRNVTKSLKKLFNELKIPCEKRDKLMVVANSNTVLWVEGIGTSKTARISADTKSAVRILKNRGLLCTTISKES